jgi:hypothetical protein
MDAREYQSRIDFKPKYPEYHRPIMIKNERREKMNLLSRMEASTLLLTLLSGGEGILLCKEIRRIANSLPDQKLIGFSAKILI